MIMQLFNWLPKRSKLDIQILAYCLVESEPHHELLICCESNPS